MVHVWSLAAFFPFDLTVHAQCPERFGVMEVTALCAAALILVMIVVDWLSG